MDHRPRRHAVTVMDVLQIDACCHEDGFDRRGVRDRGIGISVERLDHHAREIACDPVPHELLRERLPMAGIRD